EHLRDFAQKFRDDVKSFSYAQKKALVDILVERIEISDTKEGRTARVLFRFDPKEIAAAMTRVEPVLSMRKPKIPLLEASSEGNGGSEGLGYYLFAFPTPVGFLGNNQYKTLSQ